MLLYHQSSRAVAECVPTRHFPDSKTFPGTCYVFPDFPVHAGLQWAGSCRIPCLSGSQPARMTEERFVHWTLAWRIVSGQKETSLTLNHVQHYAHCMHSTLKIKISTNKAFLKALGSHCKAMHYVAATQCQSHKCLNNLRSF